MVDIFTTFGSKNYFEKNYGVLATKIIFGDLIPSSGLADAIAFARSQPYQQG